MPQRAWVFGARADENVDRAAGGEALDPSDLVAAAKADGRRARTVLAEAAAEAGRVLAALSNTVAPSLIVVGGELAEAGPYVMEPIERELETHVVRSIRTRMTLRPATLGTAVAALGAVALVLRPGGAGVRLPSSLRRPKAVEPSTGHPALGGLARSGPEGTRPDVRVGRSVQPAYPRHSNDRLDEHRTRSSIPGPPRRIRRFPGPRPQCHPVVTRCGSHDCFAAGLEEAQIGMYELLVDRVGRPDAHLFPVRDELAPSGCW